MLDVWVLVLKWVEPNSWDGNFPLYLLLHSCTCWMHQAVHLSERKSPFFATEVSGPTVHSGQSSNSSASFQKCSEQKPLCWRIFMFYWLVWDQSISNWPVCRLSGQDMMFLRFFLKGNPNCRQAMAWPKQETIKNSTGCKNFNILTAQVKIITPPHAPPLDPLHLLAVASAGTFAKQSPQKPTNNAAQHRFPWKSLVDSMAASLEWNQKNSQTGRSASAVSCETCRWMGGFGTCHFNNPKIFCYFPLVLMSQCPW